MKNRYIALLILVLALMLPIYAGPTEGAEAPGNGISPGMGWEPVYRIIKSADLNIRAYKNTPDPIKMIIFDALTGNLEEISNNLEMDIYPYISKFLSVGYTDSLMKEVPETDNNKWKIADKNKVLFSYLVTGASTGTFTLEITVGSFYKTDKPIATAPDEFILAHYELGDMGVGFPVAGGGETLGDNIIRFASRPSKGVDPKGKNDGKLSVSWEILNPKHPEDKKTQNFWNSEGVIVMAIDKNAYDASSAGSFKADVLVHLKVE